MTNPINIVVLCCGVVLWIAGLTGLLVLQPNQLSAGLQLSTAGSYLLLAMNVGFGIIVSQTARVWLARVRSLILRRAIVGGCIGLFVAASIALVQHRVSSEPPELPAASHESLAGLPMIGDFPEPIEDDEPTAASCRPLAELTTVKPQLSRPGPAGASAYYQLDPLEVDLLLATSRQWAWLGLGTRGAWVNVGKPAELKFCSVEMDAEGTPVVEFESGGARARFVLNGDGFRRETSQ